MHTVDPESLQQWITECMEIIDKLDKQDNASVQCIKKLNQIRREVGIADIPELINLREKEITEFSSKLRKLENEYLELKKLIA